LKNKIIKNWITLRRRLDKERKKRKKIVFTNGCFDLIHVGHVKIFEECKRHGDVVVVGINSDRSVQWLKGPTRPIILQNDRAQLLAAFETIDFVTVFGQPTPENLINTIKPDVLVKGGDWKLVQIVGQGAVKKVVRVPLVKGRSTTGLIQKIVNLYGQNGSQTSSS